MSVQIESQQMVSMTHDIDTPAPRPINIPLHRPNSPDVLPTLANAQKRIRTLSSDSLSQSVRNELYTKTLVRIPHT